MQEDKNDFPEKLKAIFDALHIRETDFCEKTQMSSQRLNNYLKGNTKPKLDAIQRIMTGFPEINPFWLILGKGSILTDGADENYQHMIMEPAPPYNRRDPKTPPRPPVISSSEKIRKRIIHVIEEKGYTLKKLSRESHIPEETLYSQIYDTEDISTETIKAICFVFSPLSYKWLLTGNPNAYAEAEVIKTLSGLIKDLSLHK